MLGQVNALTQQIQRAAEAQALSQEEQALTKEWQEVRRPEYLIEYSGRYRPWMNEQEQYERQLYQLSQRLTLQNQLNEQQAQERQYQQQLSATRQALENALLALSLHVPEEGKRRPADAEFNLWQEKRSMLRFRAH